LDEERLPAGLAPAVVTLVEIEYDGRINPDWIEKGPSVRIATEIRKCFKLIKIR
jgi:hypothetical protein